VGSVGCGVHVDVHGESVMLWETAVYIVATEHGKHDPEEVGHTYRSAWNSVSRTQGVLISEVSFFPQQILS